MRRNSIVKLHRGCVFASAKTHTPLCIPCGFQRIASRHRSCAFFGAQLRLRTFLFLKQFRVYSFPIRSSQPEIYRGRGEHEWQGAILSTGMRGL